MRLRQKPILAMLAIAVGALCTGCAPATNQTRVKSPAELLHNFAFGGNKLTTSEYLGSDHAREWDMAEHAAAQAQQQAQWNAPPPPQ